MNKAETEINQIKLKLRALDNKESLIKIIIGLNIVVVLVLFLNVFLSLLELSGFNSIGSRTVLFYFGVVAALVGFVVFVVVPIFKRIRLFHTPNFKVLSEKVGQHYPEISDSLLNALELSEEKENYFSKTLTSAAIEEAYKKTIDVDFKKATSFNRTKNKFTISAFTIILTVLLFYTIPGLRTSSYRIINYSSEFKQTAKVRFYVDPGNTTVTKNSNVTINVEIIGDIPNSIIIATKSEEEPAYIEHKAFPDTNNLYTLQISTLKKNTEYFAESINIKSDIYKITVIDKPIISHLQLSITPPKYSGLKQYIQKDNGNIAALIGSVVELKIKSTKELSSGYIIFGDSSKQDLEIKKAEGNTSFIVEEKSEYKIVVFDSTKRKNKNPITYSITSELDEHPKIDVIEPGLNIKLTKSEQVLTHLKISDDYGFKSLLLHHRLSASSFEPPSDKFSKKQITFDGSMKEQDVYSVWDVSDLLLTAGDVVSFYYEVFDNDNVSGPKSTKTSLHTLYVPTIEELYSESEVVQEEAIKEIIETAKEAEKLNEELEKLNNELKVDEEEISWDEKKKIEETVQKFEELKKKIEKAQEKLSKNKNELEQNDLLSPETLEKYNELQKLMDEMNSEETKDAMSKLRQQLESMNRENTQKSLEETKFNEEMFRKSLERTVSLLKRIQVEQKMDEVIKRAEKIKEALSELEKETQKSDLSNKEEENKLTEKQKNITEQLKRLKEETDKLRQKMSELSDMPNEQMKELQKDLESQKNEEMSKKTEEQISKEMKMEAMEQMQMLSQNMERTSQQMQSMQQQMQMENQLQTMYDMMKSINNLIDLSKQEEELKKSTEQGGGKQLPKSAQSQSEILSGLEKTIKQLSELSQKTFAITPEMGKALGQAKAEMQNSINAMQNQNGNMAALGQTGAMKYLNEAATMMKGKMDQMMNGGEGGGMMSMMQQMQQLSQQQMSLNKLTQQLNKGELTQQQQMEMQRLSQQQEIIKKSLAQLNKETKESGESKRVASNLEKILEEMEEVITKMRTETLSDDLLQSQEKILSKLLDAQRSINKRDFEEQRESNSGNRFSRESPDEINLSAEERKNKIRDELLKAIKEGYSQDYEDLIRKYYESLENSKEKTPAKN